MSKQLIEEIKNKILDELELSLSKGVHLDYGEELDIESGNIMIKWFKNELKTIRDDWPEHYNIDFDQSPYQSEGVSREQLIEKLEGQADIDEASAYIFSNDLHKFKESECNAYAYSVRMGSPDDSTKALFSIDDIKSILDDQSPSEPEWVSVEDRLPEETHHFGGSGFSDDLLVVDSEGDIFIGYYFFPWGSQKLKGFKVSSQKVTMPITHWMPLPEPPKGENDE